MRNKMIFGEILQCNAIIWGTLKRKTRINGSEAIAEERFFGKRHDNANKKEHHIFTVRQQGRY